MCFAGSCQASRLCLAGAADSDPGGCAGAGVCVQLDAGGLGVCVTNSCELFDSGGCQGDELCAPAFGEVRNAAGVMIGLCLAPTGSLTAGTACTVNTQCLPGLACVDGECQRLCDVQAATSGQGACGAGDASLPLIDLTVGVCVRDECDPFDAAACPSGEVCVATSFVPSLITGTCETPGTKQVAEACSGWASADCAAWLICLGDGAGGAFCWPSCDPQAAAGSTYVCGAGQTCFGIGTTDGAAAENIGYCWDTCVPWAADDGCAFATRPGSTT